MVFSGALATGKVWITLIFLVGAILTIIYLFRVFNLVFLGEARVNRDSDHFLNKAVTSKNGRCPYLKTREANPIMLFSVGLLAVLSLVGGILIFYPYSFAQIATQQMLGVIK